LKESKGSHPIDKTSWQRACFGAGGPSSSFYHADSAVASINDGQGKTSVGEFDATREKEAHLRTRQSIRITFKPSCKGACIAGRNLDKTDGMVLGVTHRQEITIRMERHTARGIKPWRTAIHKASTDSASKGSRFPCVHHNEPNRIIF